MKRPRRSLWVSVIAALAAGAALPAVAADPGELAAIVAEHQVTRPRLNQIPVDSLEAFDRWLAALDPFARRMSAAEYEAHMAALSPVRTGIGGAIFGQPDAVRWVSYRSGPAAMAGAPAEGELVAVNDLPVAPPLDLSRVTAALQAGGPVARLRFAHAATAVEIRQDRFTAPILESWDISGTRIVRIFRFVEGRTVPSMQAALKGASRVVLDLRFSDGGDLFGGLDATGVFLNAGTPIGGLMSADGRRLAFTAPDVGPPFRGNLVVLTSPFTASTAEVVAAALQYHGRARIAGTGTFGKCLAQQVFHLSDGGALRLSVERLLRPSGSDCTDQPIAPDIAMPTEEIFDTPWLFTALGVTRPQPGLLRVCETAGVPSPAAARQREIEIRLVLPPGTVPATIEPATTEPATTEPKLQDPPAAVPEYRVCLGPMPDKAAAEQLAAILSDLLGHRFEVARGR